MSTTPELKTQGFPCRIFMNILCKIEIFQEDGLFVALAPELNVSSYAETLQDAKISLSEALNAFFEKCQNMGTLDEVLEESGFILEKKVWVKKKPLLEEQFAIAV